MYKFFLIIFFSINIIANDNNLFNDLNKYAKVKEINNFAIKIENNKISIINKNSGTWFIRITNLENNMNLINNYIYENIFTKNISTGFYNIYIKDTTTNKEINFDFYSKVEELNDISNFIINKSIENNKRIAKNSLDSSYTLSIDGNGIEIRFNDDTAKYVRLSSFGDNILNGYYYSSFKHKLEEGLYNIYIKTNTSEIEKIIYIFSDEKSIIEELEIKGVNLIRDIPFFYNDEYTLQWYPIKINNIEYRYLIELKTDTEVKSFISDNSFFNIKELDYKYYRVFAFPSIVYSGDDVQYLKTMYNLSEKNNWTKLEYSKNLDYLIGKSEILEGNIENLSLYLPSGFAFADNKDEYIITSADKGHIIHVKNNKFKRYIFKNNLGMPLQLSNPIFKSKNKFIMIDNSNSRIVEFNTVSKQLKTIFGDHRGEYEQDKMKDIIYNNEKLGIMSDLYEYNNEISFSMYLRYQENKHSWYSIPIGLSNIYKLYENTISKKNIDLCNLQSCRNIFDLIEFKLIITKDSIIKYVENEIVWRYNINGFGAGIAFINNKKEILFGNHTELLRLDLESGKKIDLESDITFANIVDIDKVSENEFVITDSDSGTVYFTKLIDNKLKNIKSISNSMNSSPNIIKIKNSKNDLFVLTSNPSYLYKINLTNYKVDFLIGNGTNSYAVETDDYSNTSMYYPNDFFIDEDDKIYITEANHRILMLNNKNLSIFAGSIEHSKANNGKQDCNSSLFTNIRSIIRSNDSFILSDSGNNRLLSMKKIDYICDIKEIKLIENGEIINFNNNTFLFINNNKIYLIEQDSNRILVFDKNFKIIETIGSKVSTVYQGMGKDNDFSVVKSEAYFSTPTDICFDNNKERIYVTDLFNGKIKVLNKKGIVEKKSLKNKDFILPMSCSVNNKYLYYVDGFTDKVFIDNN